MIIGLVGVAISSSSLAIFTDEEESSDNTFVAGELDLQIDWNESYNGEHVERQELTNNPGSIFNLEDIKPGDSGKASVSLHLDDNPGWIWMSMNQTSNWDNACTEPENEAEGQCGSKGELGEHLTFTIWADDGDKILQEEENVIFEGTAHELSEESQISNGVLLDGNPETENVEAFAGEETNYVGIKWKVPLEVGNEIQADSKKFDISFYTEQERHNPQETEVTEDEVEYEAANWQLDLVEGEVIENLSSETYSERNDLERYAHGLTNESGPQKVGDTGHNNQIECLESSSDFTVTGTATDAQATVEFEVSNQSECNGAQLTHVSYRNTGPLGWSGGVNQEVFENNTIEVESGEEYELDVEIPSATIASN